MNGMTASKMFYSANRVMEAYHNMLRPLCKKTGLPPMAVDILMFISNNPDNNTARDICLMRGLKSGIVSVHVERLVNEGLLTRETVPNDPPQNSTRAHSLRRGHRKRGQGTANTLRTPLAQRHQPCRY